MNREVRHKLMDANHRAAGIAHMMEAISPVLPFFHHSHPNHREAVRKYHEMIDKAHELKIYLGKLAQGKTG